MDYEVKYKEALERAKERYSACSEPALLEYIFPELKESEDERMRENLYKCLRYYVPEDIAEEYIAWLEKQKDVSSIERVFRPIAGCDIADAATQAIEQQQLGYKIVLAFNGAYIRVEEKTADDIVNEYYSWLKKQNSDGTSKEWTINDATTLNELIDFLENGTTKLQHDLTIYANWLKIQFAPNEKQGGDGGGQVIFPTFTFDDVLALQCCLETVKKVREDKDLYEKLNDLHSRVYDAYHLEKQDEQKPYGQRKECFDCQSNYVGVCKGYCYMKRVEQKFADKVKQKFHEGD